MKAADSEASRAETLFAQGDRHAALATFWRARQAFADVGLELDVAYCEQRIGNVLDDLGHHDEAEQHLVAARSRYVAAGDQIGAAYCDQSLGSALYQRNRHDEALARFEAALRGLGDAEPAEVAACKGNLAIVLSALGEHDRARLLLEAALAASTSSGNIEHAGRWELNLGNVAVATGRLVDAAGHFMRARQAFEELGRALEVAYCDHNLANLSAIRGVPAEAMRRAKAARAAYDAAGLPVKVAAADMSIAHLELAGGDGASAVARLEAARTGFAAAGLALEAAACDHDLAVAADRNGDFLAALRRALPALAVVDAHRYTLRYSKLRHTWSLRHAALYALCFELAAEAGDASLVAELIESARVQGIPAAWRSGEVPSSSDEEGIVGRTALDMALAAAADDGSVSRHGVADPDARSAALAALGLLPLAPCPAVSVDGPSRLGAAETGVVQPPAVAVDDARRAVGGAQSWWWGTWESGNTLWWSLLRPGRAAESGRIDLAPGSAANSALARLRLCLPDSLPGESRQDAWGRQAQAPLGTGAEPGAEAALALALGRALLPPPLAAELTARATADDEPLSLVIAPAPILGAVPFAVVAVPGGPTDREPPRVMETAVVRLAPSVALLDAVRAGPSPPCSARRPLALAVLDPVDDLRHARMPPPGARRILTGHLTLAHQPPDISGLASRSGVAEALGHIGKGAPAVLVYQGHALAGSPGTPATAALVLSDGELTAADLLGAEAGCPQFPMPERVLLSACTSSGAGHGGEWLGLAPAALWAGARTVVATSWSVLDDAAVRDCDTELARMLRRADDVAAGLRLLQLDRLAAWRHAPASSAPPVVWAAYVVVEAGSEG